MINIKYDCPESNSEMVKTECGFYCSACSKDVFDFTEKSNEQIIQIRTANPSITCGVFRADQATIDVRSKVHTIFRVAFVAIFVLGLNISLLFGQDANMQSSAIVTSTEVVADGVILTGTIKSEKGSSLEAWISYYIGEEAYAIDSDENGNFTINLPKEMVGQKINLSFYARGYHLKEVAYELKAAKCYTVQVELKKYKKPLLRKNQMVRGRF